MKLKRTLLWRLRLTVTWLYALCDVDVQCAVRGDAGVACLFVNCLWQVVSEFLHNYMYDRLRTQSQVYYCACASQIPPFSLTHQHHSSCYILSIISTFYVTILYLNPSLNFNFVCIKICISKFNFYLAFLPLPLPSARLHRAGVVHSQARHRPPQSNAAIPPLLYHPLISNDWSLQVLVQSQLDEKHVESEMLKASESVLRCRQRHHS